jgi:hypothetical protein
LVFITEMKSVYCAVRTGSLKKAVCASYLKRLKYFSRVSLTKATQGTRMLNFYPFLNSTPLIYITHRVLLYLQQKP